MSSIEWCSRRSSKSLTSAGSSSALGSSSTSWQLAACSKIQHFGWLLRCAAFRWLLDSAPSRKLLSNAAAFRWLILSAANSNCSRIAECLRMPLSGGYWILLHGESCCQMMMMQDSTLTEVPWLSFSRYPPEQTNINMSWAVCAMS